MDEDKLDKQQQYLSLKIDYKSTFIQNFLTLPSGIQQNNIDVHNPSFVSTNKDLISQIDNFAGAIDKILSNPTLLADASEIVHKL